MSVADVILYKPASCQVFNLVYELPEDCTGVPKYVEVVKDGALKCLCSLYFKLIL
jgi:hypothetical protein